MLSFFWPTIGESPVETSADIESALQRISGRLEDLEPAALLQIDDQLRECLYHLDRRELAEIPVVLHSGFRVPQSSGHFLSARCACILAGEEAYEACLRSRDGFARFVLPFVGAAEELLYLAANEYENKLGMKMEGMSEFTIEKGSNAAGWD